MRTNRLNRLLEDKIYNQTSCIDAPDNRDYPYDERVGFKSIMEEAKATPNYIRDENKVTIQNQWSVGACTRFALVHLINAYNIKEYELNWEKYTQLDAMEVWNRGDKQLTLQAALKQAVSEWLIAGYTTIVKTRPLEKQIQLINEALDGWKLIYSGSLSCNRSKTKQTKQFTYDPTRKNGHAHGIVKKNPFGNYFGYRYMSPNSRGASRWDKWYFHTDPADIKYRYTKYVIIDQDDSAKFKLFKAIQKAKQIKPLCSDLYALGDQVIKTYFEKIQIGKFLSDQYGI